MCSTFSSPFGSFGSAGAPGFLSPFDTGQAQQGVGTSLQAMTNRYQQLGLGQQGATPTSPGAFGAGPTGYQMDIGQLPSLTGGIPEEFQAVLGQLQTANLNNQSGGGKSGGKSALGGLTPLLGLAGGI